MADAAKKTDTNIDTKIQIQKGAQIVSVPTKVILEENVLWYGFGKSET